MTDDYHSQYPITVGIIKTKSGWVPLKVPPPKPGTDA